VRRAFLNKPKESLSQSELFLSTKARAGETLESETGKAGRRSVAPMSEVGGRQEALDLLCYSLQGVERAMAGLGRLILVGTAFTLYLIALLFLLSIGNWQDAKQSPIASLLPYWKKEVLPVSLNFLIMFW